VSFCLDVDTDFGGQTQPILKHSLCHEIPSRMSPTVGLFAYSFISPNELNQWVEVRKNLDE
jgi:hypothetical protein